MKGFLHFTIIIAARIAAISSTTVPTLTAFSPSQSIVAPIHRRNGPKPNDSKTSLDLSPAILVRGGAAAGEVVLKSFYGDALGFFGGIRIPATFLAGSSLAAIFTLKNAANSLANDADLTKLERRVIKFYHLASVVSFLLGLSTIILATSAYTSVLHGRFDHMAETAYLLLKREFEFEFVFVRWSFLMSLFCFLGMITSRVLIEFDLLKECRDMNNTKKDVAMLVICSVGALTAQLLSYVNVNLWCWKSLVGMTIHLTKLICEKAFVCFLPMQVVSVLCTVLSLFYVGKLALKDIREVPGKESNKQV